MSQSDLPAVCRLSTQAGWNQLAADWQRLLRLFPGKCLAGCIGEELIATATLATYGTSLGWVGMILVDQAYRGHGYGTTMFDGIVGLGGQLGIATLGLDATNLGQPLYRKRGFVAGGPINRWVGQAAMGGQPDARCVAPGAADWDDIRQLDRSCLGVDRFQVLRAIGQERGACVRVLRQGGELVGFAFSRPGRTASHIGPLIARSTDAAQVLTNSVLCHIAGDGASSAVMIDIPGNSPLEAVAAASGLAISRRLLRMFFPKEPAEMRGNDQLARAAAGFELG